MATLDLFDHLPPSRANEWHRVGAPGGYEWWEFDAEDQIQGIRVVLSLYDGFAFDPEYARRYDAYRRRPTRRSPPIPRQYPCVQCAVYENEVALASVVKRLPAGAFQADRTANTLNVGPDHLKFGDTETIVRIQAGEPAISAELVFRPKCALTPMEQTFLPRDATGAEHHWVLAQPLCDAEGQIRVGGRNIPFRGLGYHDHYYGSGPIVLRWMRGRVILPNCSVAFHVFTEHATGLDQSVILTADEAGAVSVARGHFSCDWNKRTWRGLAYPSGLDFGRSLILRNARIADSSPNWLQLIFDAYLDGEICKAWAQIVYPARLTAASWNGWRAGK
jgi:carotenoid 1,2-hydratase